MCVCVCVGLSMCVCLSVCVYVCVCVSETDRKRESYPEGYHSGKSRDRRNLISWFYLFIKEGSTSLHLPQGRDRKGGRGRRGGREGGGHRGREGGGANMCSAFLKMCDGVRGRERE